MATWIISPTFFSLLSYCYTVHDQSQSHVDTSHFNPISLLIFYIGRYHWLLFSHCHAVPYNVADNKNS